MGEQVRILRLGNSTDVDDSIPEGERSAWLSAAVFARETGTEPRLTVRPIWPTERLPSRLDGWLDDDRPQVVFLAVNAYWFTYRSVPLRMRRLLGRSVGDRVASAGLRVGRSKLAGTRVYHLVRRLGGRTIGGDTHFSPEEVVAVMEACMRRVVSREDVVLVVRGPLAAHAQDMGRRIARENERAWWAVDRSLRALCASLHLEYEGMLGPDDQRGSFGASDRVHPDADAHRERAEREGLLMVRGWQRDAVGGTSTRA